MAHISKGLTQAYQLQDITYAAVQSIRARLTDENGVIHVSDDDAKTIAALVNAWKTCQERVSFHRRVPSPGVLKPEATGKRGKRALKASLVPMPQASDAHAGDAVPGASTPTGTQGV